MSLLFIYLQKPTDLPYSNLGENKCIPDEEPLAWDVGQGVRPYRRSGMKASCEAGQMLWHQAVEFLLVL